MGQGTYYAPKLNINGERIQYSNSTYITDLLTEHAIDWMEEQNGEEPFFLYLSHKAVHAGFDPASRHAGMYADETYTPPASYSLTTRFERDRAAARHTQQRAQHWRWPLPTT